MGAPAAGAGAVGWRASRFEEPATAASRLLLSFPCPIYTYIYTYIYKLRARVKYTHVDLPVASVCVDSAVCLILQDSWSWCAHPSLRFFWKNTSGRLWARAREQVSNPMKMRSGVYVGWGESKEAQTELLPAAAAAAAVSLRSLSFFVHFYYFYNFNILFFSRSHSVRARRVVYSSKRSKRGTL